MVNQRSLFAHWLTSDQPLVNQSAESGGVWRSLADPHGFPKNATPLYTTGFGDDFSGGAWRSLAESGGVWRTFTVFPKTPTPSILYQYKVQT